MVVSDSVAATSGHNNVIGGKTKKTRGCPRRVSSSVLSGKFYKVYYNEETSFGRQLRRKVSLIFGICHCDTLTGGGEGCTGERLMTSKRER